MTGRPPDLPPVVPGPTGNSDAREQSPAGVVIGLDEPLGLPPPLPKATSVSNPRPRPCASPVGREIIFTKASAVRPEPIRWLWNGRVPLGALTVLAGVQGLGKSTFTAWMTARVTRGDLDGDLNTAPAGILRLVPGITESEVAGWIEQRGKKPFASAEDFKARAGLRPGTLAALKF